ncbi:F-box only protein 39 [Ambystoma mexicanum]|uniref:F-box only protein 39 n=1 Tax=Ambystoma mexicanum TaxID=8296 RepID=UPI0037E776B1
MEASESMPEQSCWYYLPTVCLHRVFWWLGDKDRANAALVCKTWYDGMYAAFLWRTRSIIFSGRPSKRNASEFDSSVAYAIQFGKYVEKLEIRFLNPYNAILTRKFQITMRSLLSSLGKCNHRMRYLTIQDLGLDRLVWRTTIRNSFIKSLNFFLKKANRNLTYISLKGARLTIDQGCGLLSSLSHPKKVSYASELNIEDYFSHHLPVHSCPIFSQTIAAFCQLSTLSLNYNCISDTFLETLAETCAHTLQILNLKCHTNDPHRQVVCGTSWYKLVRRAPDLRVNAFFERVIRHEHLMRILLAEIPVRSIILRSCYFSDPDWALRPTLIDLIPQYRRTLQRFTLHVNNYSEPVDDELVQLVLHCENLAFLKIWAFLQLRFVERLLLYQQEGKCCLHTLKVRIYINKYDTKEEDMVLQEIQQKYGELISREINYFVITYPML